jgi:hypothetical protein
VSHTWRHDVEEGVERWSKCNEFRSEGSWYHVKS